MTTEELIVKLEMIQKMKSETNTLELKSPLCQLRFLV